MRSICSEAGVKKARRPGALALKRRERARSSSRLCGRHAVSTLSSVQFAELFLLQQPSSIETNLRKGSESTTNSREIARTLLTSPPGAGHA